MSAPTPDELVSAGLEAGPAALAARLLGELPPAEAWARLVAEVLRPQQPFTAHLSCYRAALAGWDPAAGPFPAWRPDPDELPRTNLGRLLAERGLGDYAALQRWSVEDRAGFWRAALASLGLDPGQAVVDLSAGPEHPVWLPGLHLNAAALCLDGDPEGCALVAQRGEDAPLVRLSRGALRAQVERVAAGLLASDLAGAAVAIDMPMTPEAVVIYLAVVWTGGVVVSIADSFSAPEIATRLRLGGAQAIFTQDVVLRGAKRLDLYGRVLEAGAPRAVVVPGSDAPLPELRAGDLGWEAFLAGAGQPPEPVQAEPGATTNVLFSSGTTGDPKAIPWTQTTPLKAGSDARFHQDVRPGDVVAWPTNLGWMMGPWLIYGSLLNGAAIALYGGTPGGAGFCRFVERAGVTMLGVVPSLVRGWRASGATDGVDWSRIRCFSSTGECSNPEDMLWLMARAGYRPVIEYCGGTEIGGGYVTGTVVQPASPATFSTPALGLDFVLRDEEGQPTDNGEVFLVPPSFGLSQTLLNRDHHQVYYAGVAPDAQGRLLRRHGDQLQALPGGYYRAHGRMDDTMNLGGIKVGSAEIERVVNRVAGIQQSAAIAVAPADGGPSRLVVYVEPDPAAPAPDPGALRRELQRRIRDELNPLFKVADVVPLSPLPRTASNKVMRRKLREDYLTRG